MNQLNQSLFFSLLKDDFQTSKKILDSGANPNAIYQISQGKFISSFNLFITKTASINQKKGSTNSQYKIRMDLMKDMIAKSTLECKCNKQHKCPLYIALQTFKITDEKQILEGKGDILRYLIINGATINYNQKSNKKLEKNLQIWKLPWLDIQGIRTYLITKKFDFIQTKI